MIAQMSELGLEPMCLKSAIAWLISSSQLTLSPFHLSRPIKCHAPPWSLLEHSCPLWSFRLPGEFLTVCSPDRTLSR